MVILVSFGLPAVAAQPPADGPRAVDEWQRNLLLNPPPSVTIPEREGRVFIYEGMLESDIDTAMDTQFERIDSMMFIRTIPTDETGEPLKDSATGETLVADDGC